MFQQILTLLNSISASLAAIASGGGLTVAQTQQVITALTAIAAQLQSITGGTPPSSPVITSLATTASVGSAVTIGGSGFGSAQGSGSVMFTGASTPAAVTMWADGAIVVTVPVGATTGPITVTTGTGSKVDSPAITIQ